MTSADDGFVYRPKKRFAPMTRREDDPPPPDVVMDWWLQVRAVGSKDWSRLRSHEDEADALMDFVQQREVSQPQWEFRVWPIARVIVKKVGEA